MGGSLVALSALAGFFALAALLRRTHFQAQIAGAYDEAICDQLSALASNPLYQNANIEFNVDLGDLDLGVAGLEREARALVLDLADHVGRDLAGREDLEAL